MRRRILVPALMGAALLCTGCGIGSAPDTGADFEGGRAALGVSGATPDVLAERLGCAGFAQQVTNQPSEWQRGTCDLQGRALRLHAFSDADFRTLIRQQGPQSVHVVGDGWLVEAPDRGLAETVARQLGGQVQ